MSDGTPTRTGVGAGGNASVRTQVRAPAVVAAALRPDNTDEIHTQVVDETIETTIERPSPSGLRTTLDDYVCNLSVATAVVAIAANETGVDTAASNTDTEHAATDHDMNDHGSDDDGSDDHESTDEHFHTDDANTP